jgi:hypothetical protein
MDGTGEYHAKQSVPGSKSQRLYVFLHLWKLDLLVKCIYKHIYDHIYTYKYIQTYINIVRE